MEFSPALTRLFSELVDGTSSRTGGFVLNTGDVGLLRSLDKLSAADASRSVNDGATIAAHAQHVRYGLSLMNRWATEGGNPFADATWDEAWKTSVVDAHRVAGDSRRITRRSASLAAGAELTARGDRHRAHRDDREHRASCLPSRRDPPDQQGCARADERERSSSRRDRLRPSRPLMIAPAHSQPDRVHRAFKARR